MVVLVALLVALGVVTAYAVTSGGDDPASVAGDTPTTSAPATDEPSSATPTPDAPASTASGSSPDEQQAIDSFASALEEQGLMDATQSECVARTVVDDVGLDALVQQGFFDEDQTFLDPDLGDEPALKEALTSATFSCLT